MKRFGVALQRTQNVLHRELDQYARTLDLTDNQMSIIAYLSSIPQDKPIYQKISKLNLISASQPQLTFLD
jgi:hypothetical protein